MVLSAGRIGSCSSGAAGQPGVSRVGMKDIPADYLRMYQQAGQQYGVPWNLLAGIGHVESGHGANPGPSSGAALGPTQFMPATWSSWGVDGNRSSPADFPPVTCRRTTTRPRSPPVLMRH
jgi:membrane-bound lytic murein transglycosylase B